MTAGALALVAIATLVVFAGVLGNGFVDWDDDENFLDNPHYRGLGPTQLAWMFTTFHLGLWIPLTWMTLGLDYLVWGMEPRGYHLTSLILHAATAVAFFFVSLRLLREALRPPAGADARALQAGAAFAALLFAVHPLRVESVAWATERRDVLSGLLVMLSVLAYLRASDVAERARRLRWYGVALGTFALALLAKPIVMTLPVVLLVLDVYPLRRLSLVPSHWWRLPERRVWLEKLPYVAMSLAAGLVTLAAQRAQGSTLYSYQGLGIARRAGIACYALVFYLWKTLVPFGLSPLYELASLDAWTRAFVLSALLVVAVTAVAVALRRRCPGVAAAWAVNVVVLLPVSGLAQNGPQIAADRYTYLPMLGWSVLAGAGVALAWRAWRARRFPMPAAALLGVLALGALTALGTLTWRQVTVWHDTETLWTHALRVAPSGFAHNNMADLRLAQGRLEEGLGHVRETLRILPGFSRAHVNLGVALARLDRPVEAIAAFEAALRINPRNAAAHNNLGVLLARQGRTAEAIERFRTALELRPRYADAEANLIRALVPTGGGTEAQPHLREAQRIPALMPPQR